MLDIVHLGLDVEQRLKRRLRLLVHRAAAVSQAILRQVANREIGRLDHAARVRLVEAGEHLEERCLSGAVRTAEAYTIAVANLPGDVVEQGAVAKRFGEFGKLDHVSIARRPEGGP